MFLQWKLFIAKYRSVRFKEINLFVLPPAVNDLSLDNTDWILKSFSVHKKARAETLQHQRSQMRGYGSSCP